MTRQAYTQVGQGVPTFLQDTALELTLFGGKGGVGKTTCAAATALYLAERFPAQTFLVASTDPAHSLRDSFANDFVLPNLTIIEFDARESLAKFKNAYAPQLRQIALHGTFLDNEDVEQLLNLSIPGLDEVMAFNDVCTLVESGAYRRIVVDTAPTGHTLRFLGLPETMRKWLAALDAMLAKHRYMAKLYHGFYRKDGADTFLENMAASVERLCALLGDAARCCFVPVMTADALSIKETHRLLGKLGVMGIPVTDVLVNRLYPAGRDCPVCREAWQQERTELRRMPEELSRHSLWEIPLQGPEVRGAEQLAAFWNEVRPLRQSPMKAWAASPLPPRVKRPAKLPEPGVSLLLFAGKGGVGKTTLACATAFRLAREHPTKEVLLYSTDPAHSLSDCLGIRVGPQQTPVRPRLTAIEIDAEAEFEKLQRQYADEVASFFGSLTAGRGIRLEFDRDVMDRIVDLSPPGLDEVMALARAMELLETEQYDIFVFDTAPTGHLIRLLELPELIQDWLKVLFGLFLKYRNVFWLPKISALMLAMSRRVRKLRSLLSDPRKGQLYAVSILTEMAFEESRDLLAACRRAGIHVPALFLNLATPPGECRLCSAIVRAESKVRHMFEEAFGDIHQSTVYRCTEPRGPDRLSELGQAIYRGGSFCQEEGNECRERRFG